jgi:hypothetical protein
MVHYRERQNHADPAHKVEPYSALSLASLRDLRKLDGVCRPAPQLICSYDRAGVEFDPGCDVEAINDR